MSMNPVSYLNAIKTVARGYVLTPNRPTGPLPIREFITAGRTERGEK